MRKVSVTLDDLKSVKLRKVVIEEDGEDKENSISSPLTFGLKKSSGASLKKRQSSSHPFITLKEIKKVSLRKTIPASEKKRLVVAGRTIEIITNTRVGIQCEIRGHAIVTQI